MPLYRPRRRRCRYRYLLPRSLAPAPASGIPGGNSISLYTLAFNVYLHCGVAFLPVLLAKGIGLSLIHI